MLKLNRTNKHSLEMFNNSHVNYYVKVKNWFMLNAREFLKYSTLRTPKSKSFMHSLFFRIDSHLADSFIIWAPKRLS